MENYRPRVMCRLDATLNAVVDLWRNHPSTRMLGDNKKPMPMDVQVRALMRYLLRRLMAGDIGAATIKKEGKINGGTVSRYRVNIPNSLYLLMDGVLSAKGLSTSLLMRASIRMYPQVQSRLEAEETYIKRQGLGDPEWMSDDFLYLWNKYNDEGPVEDGVYLVRAVRDLELKFQTVVDKVSKLDLLFKNYGVEGILAADEVPLRKSIEIMDITALRAVATRWSIRMLNTDTETKVRQRITTHFGYSRGN
jgi:hypothetical protein